MRRLVRHLFTLCAVASLVMCLTVCVLWVRSYWVRDLIRWWMPTEWGAESNRGQIKLYRYVSMFPGSRPSGWSYEKEQPDDSRRTWSTLPADPGVTIDLEFAGFAWYVTNGSSVRMSPSGFLKLNHMRGWHIEIPHWSLAVLFALVSFARVHWRARIRPGLCPACSYDLRASPDRCPECGKIVG